MNEALRDWVTNVATTHYCIGSAAGPHPYPELVARFQSVIGEECLERFAGCRPLYRQVRSGGAGAFSADNFPVFDYMRPNVFVVADSNHGYKMIAVGREVAEVLTGAHSSLLHPFRYDRFATGDLHPVSNSPYPWS